MTGEEIAVIAGIVLSLAFSYIPKANTWFAGLESTYKRLIMLGLLVLVTAVIYGFACLEWFGVAATCDAAGAEALVKALIAAIIANQAAYLISPEPSAVREIKALKG